MKVYLQKVIGRQTFFKLVFFGTLRENDENSQRHGSADPDQDPHKNAMDP
jgi:hypothetical protein